MKHPQRWALLLTLVLVLGATGCATPVASPTAAPPTDQTTAQLTTAQLKARCSQLIAYFDRYRLGAEIDCRKGLYAEGISIMENLLRNKKLTPPAAGLANEPEDDD